MGGAGNLTASSYGGGSVSLSDGIMTIIAPGVLAPGADDAPAAAAAARSAQEPPDPATLPVALRMHLIRTSLQKNMMHTRRNRKRKMMPPCTLDDPDEWRKMCSRYICTAVSAKTPMTVLEMTQQQGTQSNSSEVGKSGGDAGGSVCASEADDAERGGPEAE